MAVAILPTPEDGITGGPPVSEEGVNKVKEKLFRLSIAVAALTALAAVVGAPIKWGMF